MKLRSLDEDPKTVTLGEAMLLFNRDIRELDTSISTRLDLLDRKTGRHFSFEGSIAEISLLNLLMKLYGPSIKIETFQSIPPQYVDLRERKTNERAKRQAIAWAISFRNPSDLDPEARDFLKKVRAFTLS
jgi:hypothetical protein